MGLIWLALGLLALWVLLVVAFEVAGFLVHLLIFAAAIAAIAWIVRRSTDKSSAPRRV